VIERHTGLLEWIRSEPGPSGNEIITMFFYVIYGTFAPSTKNIQSVMNLLDGGRCSPVSLGRGERVPISSNPVLQKHYTVTITTIMPLNP
jgi:hypothetical protein